jgi:hypothetical protein
VGIIKRSIAVTGCLLAGIFSSTPAFATTYYWIKGGVGNYPSASAACPATALMYNLTFTFDGVHFYSAESATCNYKYTSPEGNVSTDTNYALSRVGDSCPEGSIYNETTGGCGVVTPPKQPGEECDDQTGGTASNPMIWDATTSSCRRFTDAEGDAPCSYIKGIGGGPTAYTVAGTISSGGQAVAPPSFTDSTLSCAVSTVSTSECTVNVAGAVSCNVTGLLTGQANASGQVELSDAICPNGICTAKEPKTQTKDEPCVPVGNGSGGSSCNQTKETTAEGSQQCGSVNGAYTCVTKKPASNGVTTAITATSQTLPDGSVKVTTVKDSTLTVCTDVNTCTTTKSTTTQHSTTSPSGGTKTETTCTGSCNSTGGGVETNPGAGTGVGNGGNGTCTGDDCGEGEGGTADVTQDCMSPPPCDGDPFQCAILKQAHIDTCKLMAPPTAAEQAVADAKVDAAYAALDAHQSALDQQASTLLGQFQSSTPGSGTGGGKCLPDFQFSVMGMSQSMEFSKVCDSISWVRLMVLAGAYLFAARIVSREV